MTAVLEPEAPVPAPEPACPILTAGVCTVEVCVNLNDPVRQAGCSLC